jgi:hypothetical protein
MALQEHGIPISSLRLYTVLCQEENQHYIGVKPDQDIQPYHYRTIQLTSYNKNLLALFSPI